MLIIIILYMYIISLSEIYSEGYRRSLKNAVCMTNIWIHPSIRTIALGVMNFMILVDHSLVILSMPDLCSGVEEGTFREMMHFHYLTNMTRPYHKHHEGHEIYKCCGPFLGNYYYIPSLSDLCRKRRRFLKKTSKLHFLIQNYASFGEGGHEIYPTCTTYHFVKIGPEKKMLTDDARRT